MPMKETFPKNTSPAEPGPGESGHESENPGLDAEVLRNLLRDEVDLEIECLETAGSTNDLASRFLLSHRPNECCRLVTADYQHAGRGRRGRKWLSPPNLNLLFSIAIPVIPQPESEFKSFEFTPGLFNLAAALAVCEAVEACSSLHPSVKWPNDVHICGRKLAGVLCEAIVKPGSSRICGMVVGIGLNTNQETGQFDPEIQSCATSLKIETGRNWDRAGLVTGITRRLVRLARCDDAFGWEAALQGWKERCDTLGRWVRVQMGDKVFEGTALGLEPDGSLTVRLDDGTQSTFSAGEITVVE
jgi:BirA family biotin operon repressor/biotin-[acetyl-CoA-carboxylase] ligase